MNTTELTKLAKAKHAEFKAAHPAYLLLFEVGDLYVTFGTDRTTVARVIGRESYPVDRIEVALRTLIAAGHRVALCKPTDH